LDEISRLKGGSRCTPGGQGKERRHRPEGHDEDGGTDLGDTIEKRKRKKKKNVPKLIS
jgi:hypothetical protein